MSDEHSSADLQGVAVLRPEAAQSCQNGTPAAQTGHNVFFGAWKLLGL